MLCCALSSVKLTSALTSRLAAFLICFLALCAMQADAGLIFTIRVENSVGGAVQVRMGGGREWVVVGHVTQPATRVIPSFPAAVYVSPSAVAATSVHGIRIRVPSSRSEPDGISIQPHEFQTMPLGYGGHIPGESAIVTDISAGTAIFRDFAPVVGDTVLLERQPEPIGLPLGWQPSDGDVILIECTGPETAPEFIEFENRKGGAVTTQNTNGSRERIGSVTHAVIGIGRFDGTSYTGIGAINTNHGGVITVSTAPASRPLSEGGTPESRGGFEIQPLQHSRSQPEMPQAMIVAPTDPANTFEGAAPLFFGVITLGDGSPVVDIKIAGGPWRQLPAMLGKVDDALTEEGFRRLTKENTSGSVTAIRIRLRQRDPIKLAALLEKLRQQEPEGSEPGEKRTVQWALKMPIPSQTSYVIFTVQGRTLAISNVLPYQLKADGLTNGAIIRGEIMGQDGSVLETRVGRVRVSGSRVWVEEQPKR